MLHGRCRYDRLGGLSDRGSIQRRHSDEELLAAVAVALVSQAMARHFKAPVILFVIPGILPMVPGAGMYRIVYSIVMGPENMVGTYLLETATAAGAIALGIFLGEALQKVFFYEFHR